MKQLTYGDETLLVGDDIAEVLLEYAARLARHGGGDMVDVRAIGSDGVEVTATFLLGEVAPVTETVAVARSSAEVPEPGNADLEARLRAEIARRRPAWMDTPDPLEDPELIAWTEKWARRPRN